ncbi:hypothetical protein [Corynebacterium qintianiae]|uniref:hypothetical protein n=1 Tax=Corynebacterium qintianiae TaxID=2709392 RepID=UPI0013EC6B3B|nr:hypothetical protein [Corynebacterium qintianiae]
MTDEFDLRHAAKSLAGAYRELRSHTFTKQQTENLRPMVPSFGPGDPAPDGGWSFNIEHLLVHPHTDDDHPDHEAPVGLHEMVVDAQRYITNRTIQTYDGHRLAMFVYTHAWEIAEHFPAADDLLDLMHAQERYIGRALARRYPQQRTTPQPSDVKRAAITAHLEAKYCVPLDKQ